MKKLTVLSVLLFSISSLCFSQDAMERTAKNQISKFQQDFGLTNLDVANPILTDSYKSESSGVTNFFYRQQVDGIEIENANINIHIDRNGKVVFARNTFVRTAKAMIKNAGKGMSAKQAVQIAATDLSLSLKNLSIEKRQKNLTLFSKSGIASEPIRAHQLYYNNGKKDLRLVWKVGIYTADYQHNWQVYIDAVSGEIIRKKDEVLHCNFGGGPPVGHTCKEEHSDVKVKAKSAYNNFIGASNKNAGMANSYTAYPLGVESPSHGNRVVLTNPADATASPFGWHDTNGAAGAEYTITRGNNVLAQEDRDGNNGNGGTAEGGASLDFNFPLNLNNTPASNEDANITNLFVWNNFMHDVWYHYGFDEASGNFQQNNYGRGGSGNDYVLADAQDGSGTNNANFGTPGDGNSPRMQMFLWSAATSGGSSFTVNSPGSVAGSYGAEVAQFGPSTFNITGNLVIANPNEACAAISNGGALNGNIALIDRGACQFGSKVLRAQNAGAVAVIICNNVATAPIAMSAGSDGGSVTIPSMMISQADCATIRVQIPTVNITMTSTPATGQQIDGDLDNGIIAHEYGHGISTRLTGGPATSCLGSSEQQGEGWSDWFGLVLTQQASHTKDTPRGIGTYALGESTAGGGIRTFQYSYDMNINPHTYNDIGGEAVPHGVGSVWCAMIWDMYWDLIDAHGFDSDIYYGTGGNNIAMNLVLEGIKLQGCNPGFVTSRDAILAADQALYGGANECTIWNSFARRGLGFGASEGSVNSNTDGTESYALPPGLGAGVSIAKTADKYSVAPGETITFTLRMENTCASATDILVTDDLPIGLSYVSGSASNGGTHNGGIISWPSIPTLTQGNAVIFTYEAKVDAGATLPPNPSIVDDLENGAGNWSTSTAATGTVTSSWALQGGNPCGSTGWYAEELEAGGSNSVNQFLDLDPVLLNGASVLTFDHFYDTEANWDGGRVEISTNGGTSWTDLGPFMTSGGYTDFIQNNSGIPAFAGLSTSCETTSVDLSSFACTEAIIRFNFYYDPAAVGTAGNGIADGWYIDAIDLQTNATLVNSASAVTNGTTLTDIACLEILPAANLLISPEVLLEGPLNIATGLMRTDLKIGNLIPLTEPYTALGMHTGDETVTTAVLNNTPVVDWVLVELRDKDDNSNILGTKAGLLLDNGSVVSEDGSSPIAFAALPGDNYYVTIKHRNHLGVMSSNTIALNGATSTLVDFTSIPLNGLNPTKVLGGSLQVLWAGDADASGGIDAGDRSLTWNNRNQTLYFGSDCNLDGLSDASDRSMVWNNRNNIQQIP